MTEEELAALEDKLDQMNNYALDSTSNLWQRLADEKQSRSDSIESSEHFVINAAASVVDKLDGIIHILDDAASTSADKQEELTKEMLSLKEMVEANLAGVAPAQVAETVADNEVIYAHGGGSSMTDEERAARRAEKAEARRQARAAEGSLVEAPTATALAYALVQGAKQQHRVTHERVEAALGAARLWQSQQLQTVHKEMADGIGKVNGLAQKLQPQLRGLHGREVALQGAAHAYSQQAGAEAASLQRLSARVERAQAAHRLAAADTRRKLAQFAAAAPAPRTVYDARAQTLGTALAKANTGDKDVAFETEARALQRELDGLI